MSKGNKLLEILEKEKSKNAEVKTEGVTQDVREDVQQNVRKVIITFGNVSEQPTVEFVGNLSSREVGKVPHLVIKGYRAYLAEIRRNKKEE